MDSDPVTTLLKTLGISGAGLLALIGLFTLIEKIFPGIGKLFGALLRATGWAGKWIRKSSIAAEIQGGINQVISSLNSEFETPILPGCEIKWVTAENKESRLELGKAIVRLSFYRNNDLNTYNAAQLYAQTAVLAKTKPFISKPTNKAIDLIVVKNILLGAKRSALSTFNTRFRDVEATTKDTFFKLEEIHHRGLFSRILLVELEHFGDVLGEKTPALSMNAKRRSLFSGYTSSPYENMTKNPIWILNAVT